MYIVRTEDDDDDDDDDADADGPSIFPRLHLVNYQVFTPFVKRNFS